MSEYSYVWLLHAIILFLQISSYFRLKERISSADTILKLVSEKQREIEQKEKIQALYGRLNG